MTTAAVVIVAGVASLALMRARTVRRDAPRRGNAQTTSGDSADGGDADD